MTREGPPDQQCNTDATDLSQCLALSFSICYCLGCAAVIPFQTVALPFKVILHFVLFILIPTFIRVSTNHPFVNA